MPKKECVGCISNKKWKNLAHPVKKRSFFYSSQFPILLQSFDCLIFFLTNLLKIVLYIERFL